MDADALMQELGGDEGFLGGAIVRADGRLLDSTLPNGLNPQRLGEMTASLYGCCEVTGPDLGTGTFQAVQAEFADRTVLVLPIDADHLLTGVTQSDADLEDARERLRGYAEQVRIED